MRKVYKHFVMPLVLLSAFGVTSLTANAQNENQNVLAERKERGLEWIVRAGVSFNNLTGSAMKEFTDNAKELQRDIDKLDIAMSVKAGYKTTVSYDVAAGFNHYIGKSNFYWGMYLGLGTRGASSEFICINETNNQKAYLKSTLNTYNIKFIPAEFGYRLPLTNTICLDVHAGVYGLFDIFGSNTVKTKEFNSREQKEKNNIYDDSSICQSGCGLQIGGGIWYKRFNLNFTWQRGLVKFIESTNDKNFKSSNAIVSFGYAF